MTPPTHRFFCIGSYYENSAMCAGSSHLYSNRVGGVMTPPYDNGNEPAPFGAGSNCIVAGEIAP